jgi:hypothetical protein
MTTSIQHSASIGFTHWHRSTALSLMLASLLLAACGGGSPPSGVASVTAEALPPCGIEGSGAHAQGCTRGPLIPPVVVNGASVCTPPPTGPSAPAGPLVIGGNLTGRPGTPSFIYVAQGDGKHPLVVYGPELATSPTITGFIRAGLDGISCSSVDLTTVNGRELGLHVDQTVYLQVSATTRPPSLSGSLRDKAGTYALTASGISGSSYDMSVPATVASAAGSWILSDVKGSRVGLAVDSAGNVTGDYGCPFTGVLSPSPESVNLLRVQLSMTACATGAMLTGTHEGFALVMPLISGGSQLLIWAETNNGVDSSYVLAMGRR